MSRQGAPEKGKIQIIQKTELGHFVTNAPKKKEFIMIEYMRQEPPDQKEGVTCAICNEDFDLDVCITVRYKDICMPCFDMILDEAKRVWKLPLKYDW